MSRTIAGATAAIEGYPRQIPLLIHGQEVAGDRLIEVTNPSTGQIIGRLASATQENIQAALESSAQAFASWRFVPAMQRGSYLAKAATLIRGRADAIARMMTLEQGKPLAQAQLEIALCAETFDWYAAEASRNYGRILPARVAGARQMVLPEALGPVAALTPWNFPALLAARKIAPALAAGCTCILKPAEETPASPFALVQALIDADLPPGVLNVLYGSPAEISSQLIESPVIRKISFTGSVPVGRLLGEQAGRRLKPVTLELGGHSPVIVMDDADVAAAAQISAIGKTRNSGQVCTSPTRFFVHRAIHAEFTDRFTAAMAAMPVGDGLDPVTQMGPLANMRRVNAMEELVADAVAGGANVATGGARIGNAGCFFEPTVLTDLAADAKALQNEPFGPIAMVLPFDDLDEALGRANDIPLGLAGYAFTRAHSNAVAIAERLEVGMLGINSFAVSHTEAPFGGTKDSGYGYEGGHEGILAYTHQKYVHHA